MKVPRLDRLTHLVDVGEGPGEQGEGGADREQLVAGHLMIFEHVGEQGARGVEVDDRLERRGVRQQFLAAGGRLDQQQDRRRQREADGDAGEARRVVNGEDDEAEQCDPEQAEDGLPDAAGQQRVEEDGEELPGEEDRRRLTLGVAQHGSNATNWPGRAGRAVLIRRPPC